MFCGVSYVHVPAAFHIAILYIQPKITHMSRLASEFMNKRVNNENIDNY